MRIASRMKADFNFLTCGQGSKSVGQIMRNTVIILHTPIDRLDTAGVLTRLDEFIQQGGFHQIATANTDYLVNALRDAELMKILNCADLVTPDGMPVVWASGLLGSPLPERVTGVDLIPRLADLAARNRYRVYLLGARAEVNEAACRRLIMDNPGLRIVGSSAPPDAPLDAMDSDQILSDIERARPDILLVAFGNPKQEKWIHRNRERLKSVAVCIGVGGTFDFLAGRFRRAPVWMQRRGLEWLFRIVQEPRRLIGRYNRDFWVFGYNLLKQRAAQRSRRPVRTQPARQVGNLRLRLAADAIGDSKKK